MYCRMIVTPEKMAKIDAMMARGCRYKDVMAETGLSFGTIYRAHKKQFNYSVGPRLMPVSTRIPGEAREYRMKIPMQTVLTIDALVDDGHTFEEIAVALGCGWQTIKRANKRIGAYAKAPERVAQ